MFEPFVVKKALLTCRKKMVLISAQVYLQCCTRRCRKSLTEVEVDATGRMKVGPSGRWFVSV